MVSPSFFARKPPATTIQEAVERFVEWRDRAFDIRTEMLKLEQDPNETDEHIYWKAREYANALSEMSASRYRLTQLLGW